MALEDIFTALEEQAGEECAEILESAREQVSVIAEEAAEEAATIRNRRVENAERAATAVTGRQLNAARLEAKKRVASVKEAAVRDVYERALADLGKVRGAAGYEALFRDLAAEALEGVSGQLDVLVDPADAKLGEKVLADLAPGASVRGDISTAGGLVVVFEGGRIMRRNTLEDRLEKSRRWSQAQVAEMLFA
ncbi:MAG: hypothetical protein C0418_06285 [Coriobacteriaceae bacterium]|nr:hypothetical protein [Coriobacteriaceae bacterium]